MIKLKILFTSIHYCFLFPNVLTGLNELDACYDIYICRLLNCNEFLNTKNQDYCKSLENINYHNNN